VQAQQAQAANLQVLATEQTMSQQQQEHEQFVEDSVTGADEMREAAAQNGMIP
jgi:type IV secretion system protein VirB5